MEREGLRIGCEQDSIYYLKVLIVMVLFLLLFNKYRHLYRHNDSGISEPLQCLENTALPLSHPRH